MVQIAFGRQVCGNLAEAAAREWLVSDGIGGFAMGTVAGLRTRRYHGLLVVAGEPVGRRWVGLAELDVVVVLGDRRVRLSTHEWASGAVDPAGHILLDAFDLTDGVPRWRWRVGAVMIEREVAMTHGRPAVAVRHRVLAADDPIRLEVTPLCLHRDAHGEQAGQPLLSVTTTTDGFVVDDRYRVRGPGFQMTGGWYNGAVLREEAARGLPHTEDLWAAGRFAAELAAGESLDVTAWADDLADAPEEAAETVAAARRRAARLAAAAGPMDDVTATLVLAADQFVVRAPSGPAVVAGYPWFGSWSRDTMVSYEGLFLSTQRAEEGRELLLHSASTLSEGMLANTADTGPSEFNTADSTLWFVHAVDRHVDRTDDLDLAAAVLPSLDTVVQHHLAGTRFGIAADPVDGLLREGAGGRALTWMDAVIDGVPVTRRAGKAVEINALWINALAAVTALRARVGGGLPPWSAVEGTARSAFRARFPRDGGLLDVVDGPGGDDASFRPNQLLAVSLPHAPLRERSIVEGVRRRLLTSLGLRTLDPADPAYRGRHRGDRSRRDEAYHQGTVWPWLIGPYVDAARATGVDVSRVFDGLDLHVREWGLGSVSETADGDAPHGATGCPFQAWSVAELLRVRSKDPSPADGPDPEAIR